MRIVVLAPPRLADWQAAVLERLGSEPSLRLVGACVDSRPPDGLGIRLRRNWRRGRRGALLVMALRAAARRRRDLSPHAWPAGLPVHVTADPGAPEALAILRELRPEALVRLGGFGIVREPLLSLAPGGVVSLHHGDLRRYRGMPPAFWEVLHGEQRVGVTAQVLAAELDAGAILAETSVAIHPGERLRAVRARAFAAGPALVVGACRALAEGARPLRLPREELGPLYTEPGLLDWGRLTLRLLRRRLERPVAGVADRGP